MGAMWRINLLGGLTACREDWEVKRFRTQKTASLLAFLSYNRASAHPREALIEMFWPDVTGETARHNLSLALSSLRRQFEPPGIPAGSVIVADRFSVGINPNQVTTDVTEFECLLRAASPVGAAEATQCAWQTLEQAVFLYRGRLLPNFYDDWIFAEQERIAEQYCFALSRLAAQREKVGDLEGATSYLQRLVRSEPLHEDAQREIMRLLAAAGRPDAAWRQFAVIKQLLQQNGDVPAAATCDLAASIARARKQSPPPTSQSTICTGNNTALPPMASAQTLTLLLMDALAALPRTIRSELCRRHGGRFLEAVGGAFVVRFAAPSDAMAFARATRMLLPPQTRMAIHTGKAPHEEAHEQGLLDRARDVLDAARTGSLLCSEAAAVLLRPEFEGRKDASLTDLGLFRPRGGTTPERLFCVTASQNGETAAATVGANALPAFTSRLPLRLTRFFGRETELQRLREWMESGIRLVTLTGAGGMGKTRLALEAADVMAVTLSGAVWFVPLCLVSEACRIVDAILGVVSDPCPAHVQPFDQITVSLSGRPSLLILDNFEHLADAGAGIVSELLERLPQLTCLVTSRQRLGLAGEQVVSLSSLPMPRAGCAPEYLLRCESVRLFVDRGAGRASRLSAHHA